LTFFQVGLLALLLSEYGLRSRAAAQAGWEGLWRPGRTVLRLVFWAASGAWIFERPGLGAVLVLLVMFVLGELGAVLLRWRLRRDLRSGRRHGTPATHLLPVVYALSFALVPVALEALQGGRLDVLAGRSGSLVGIALGACALWGWATMLTVSVVDLTRPAQVLAEEREAIGAGELIGVLERLVTFALVLAGALPAVGFVVAAKAAARFPEFKDKAFAEYFLIGTLTSVGLALVLGLVLRP
jgi:Trk-type K+ transport system membrane component